jgi:hypothetical protein
MFDLIKTCSVCVLLVMGEYLESLFFRLHNQLGNGEQQYVNEHRSEIVNRVTIIDCEAYTLAKKHYLREISIYRICDGQTFSYQIYTPLYLCDRSIAYQVKHIHGLPQVHTRCNEDFLLYRYLLFFCGIFC